MVQISPVYATAAAELRIASKNHPQVGTPLADARVVPYLASQLTCAFTAASVEDAAVTLAAHVIPEHP
ncbi:hypothetical protein ACUV84_040541 [Puccinellia chinampoensis]